MTSKKDNDTQGQSDSTVMLKLDEVPGNATMPSGSVPAFQDDPPPPEPEPGMSDSTVLGMPALVDEPESATAKAASVPELGTEAAMPAASKAPPPPPAPTARKPTGQVAAPESATLPSTKRPGSGPPRKAEPDTLDEPGRAAAPPPPEPPKRKPTGATGMRAALPDPAPASTPPRRATGMRQALPDPAPPPPDHSMSGETLMLNPDLPAQDPALAGATVLFKSVDGPKSPSSPAPSGTFPVFKDKEPQTVDTDEDEAPQLPQQANETVLFSSVAGPKKASRPGLAEGAEEPTAKKAHLATEEKPTAAKRPLQDLVDAASSEPEPTSLSGEDSVSIPGENTVSRAKRKGVGGIQLITAAVLLLCAGAFAAHFFVGKFSKPSEAELILMYPFGAGGKRMQNGRMAPEASLVSYNFTRAYDCDGLRCLVYAATEEKSGFAYEMVVRKDDDDNWQLVSSKPVSGSPIDAH